MFTVRRPEEGCGKLRRLPWRTHPSNGTSRIPMARLGPAYRATCCSPRDGGLVGDGFGPDVQCMVSVEWKGGLWTKERMVMWAGRSDRTEASSRYWFAVTARRSTRT